ncbi:E3 ubiquitin-protein ligase At1g63170-like isoform X2 [Phoenix dactylifera]|uniref:E3 ubiquitin-protein ligase At1g63170-like isoform X2 n=1 Tax=Phoenix dactylifera TaxID=42345 RepID=A0A8B7C3U5_PHODC|nr:E3 ubiquitin-protein ligase At1g63170-like isoform X2 [Phoenix dactylifera]
MNTRYYFPPTYTPSLAREGHMPIVEGHQNAPRALPLAFLMRMVMRISRARWFSFLRRVFQYQNGSRSDLVSNPFNSKPWLALESIVLVFQMVVITVTMAVSHKENPVWPLRSWLAGYNLGNLLSLPLLYWRYRHSNISNVVTDLEQQMSAEESRSSHLMNKSRTLLELFFAIWFVMGNVWIFDSRHGSFDRAPKLHVLCLTLLAWNAIVYSFPFLLFVLLCCCVPFISSTLGYNMNLASADRGASDDQISRLPHWQFKKVEPMTGTASENPECCCICLAKYGDREEVRQLPCSHLFHLRCVDQWLRIISSCPLCKQELEK